MEQLLLQMQRQIGDFVEKDRAIVTGFKGVSTALVMVANLVSAVPENFPVEQPPGQCAAIHFQESEFRSHRQLVKEAGNCFPATSCFPKDEDRNIGLRQQFHLCPKLVHDRAGSDEERVIAELFYILDRERRLRTVVREAKMPSDRLLQLLFRNRADQKIPGAKANGFVLLGQILSVRNENNGKFRTKPSQPPQDVEAVILSPGQVEHQHLWREPQLNAFDGVPRAACDFELPAIRFDGRPENLERQGLSAYHQQPDFFDYVAVHGAVHELKR